MRRPKAAKASPLKLAPRRTLRIKAHGSRDFTKRLFSGVLNDISNFQSARPTCDDVRAKPMSSRTIESDPAGLHRDRRATPTRRFQRHERGLGSRARKRQTLSVRDDQSRCTRSRDQYGETSRSRRKTHVTARAESEGRNQVLAEVPVPFQFRVQTRTRNSDRTVPSTLPPQNR